MSFWAFTSAYTKSTNFIRFQNVYTRWKEESLGFPSFIGDLIYVENVEKYRVSLIFFGMTYYKGNLLEANKK